jgi:hypothetical protein
VASKAALRCLPGRTQLNSVGYALTVQENACEQFTSGMGERVYLSSAVPVIRAMFALAFRVTVRHAG